MVRWFLTALLAFALAPSAAAAPAPGTQAAEVLRGEALDERPVAEEARGIEARGAELRERISRSKARLAALQELVTGEDVAAGARALVRHRNEMGAAFTLEAVNFAIDGAPVFSETNATGELERKAELDVFAGRLEPGHHVLGVQLVYRAAAAQGGEPQRVRLEAAHGFDVQAGRVTTVRATGHEKKGAKLEERPAVRFEVSAEAERAGAGGGHP